MKTFIKNILFLSLLLANTHCNSGNRLYSNVLRSDVFVQTYAENKYDFLFVFDTSGSFKPRRDYVKNNMSQFLGILNSRKAVDYQIAITTVDMFGGINPPLADSHGVRGNLVASDSGLKVVKSTSANPAADFDAIMANIVESNTSFWEQGLEAAYQTVLKHGSEFSRPGVPLVIIFMSDSDDWSCKDQCWGEQPETNTHWVAYPMSRYKDYFQTFKSNENSELFVFPIVGLSNSLCDVEFPGSRYMELQASLGGASVSGSVCDSELSNSFNGVAQILADRGAVFKLNSLATGSGISVAVDQQLVPFAPENYVYDSSINAIVFTGMFPRKGSVIEVIYSERN